MTTDFQQSRIALGARLRDLRAESGLSGREMARRLGWPPSKVSKLETGKQTPAPADLEAWARAVGAPDAAGELRGRLRSLETSYRSWRRQLAAGHQARQEASIPVERQAALVRAFEPSVIPGLLQTPDYARHVLGNASALNGTAPDVEEGVRARMRRQEVLYEPGHDFRFLVWEPALHARYCPEDTLMAQLDRLLGAIGLATVTLGVVPLGAELRISPKHGFWVFDERLVIAEAVNAELWLDDGADVALYVKVWEELAQAAVFGRGAQRLIARAQAVLEAPREHR